MIIKQEFVIKAREHFADLCAQCIDDAVNGIDKVQDLEDYIRWNNDMAAKSLAGDYDHTFSQHQYAYYLQTGESIALLP